MFTIIKIDRRELGLAKTATTSTFKGFWNVAKATASAARASAKKEFHGVINELKK